MKVWVIFSRMVRKTKKYFPLIIGFAILILGIYKYTTQKKTNRPILKGNKLIIQLDENWTYACLGKLCVIIPKNSEFVLFVNPNKICLNGKRMYIDSENGTIIYAIVCKNSKLEKLVRKNYTIYILNS